MPRSTLHFMVSHFFSDVTTLPRSFSSFLNGHHFHGGRRNVDSIHVCFCLSGGWDDVAAGVRSTSRQGTPLASLVGPATRAGLSPRAGDSTYTSGRSPAGGSSCTSAVCASSPNNTLANLAGMTFFTVAVPTRASNERVLADLGGV